MSNNIKSAFFIGLIFGALIVITPFIIFKALLCPTDYRDSLIINNTTFQVGYNNPDEFKIICEKFSCSFFRVSCGGWVCRCD
jgi:hypothetical protein